MSGIPLDQGVAKTFQEMRARRAYQAMVAKLSDDYSRIVVDQTFPPGTSFADVAAAVPERESRYIAYDYNYTLDGANRSKLIFLFWTPDGVKVRPRMLYAASQRSVVDAMDGVSAEIQVTRREDLVEETLRRKCCR